MSVEDDVESTETELKELVSQTLEENGLLSKIKAQLRAGLYIALENEINESNKESHIDTFLKSNLAKADVKTVFCLVREFLEYFELDFTSSVFEKESFMGILYDYKGKEKLIKDLDIGVDQFTQMPLLVQILNIARNSYKCNSKLLGNESVQNISSFINEKINDSDRDVNNATYEVPSNQNKSICNDELDSFKNISVSECSSERNPVIDVKTVSKNNLNEYIDTSISADINSNSKQSNHSLLEERKESLINSEKNTEKQEPVINEEQQKFETDDTYEGTSSIAEDSIPGSKETPLIDLDKTGKIITSALSPPAATVKCLIDQTLDESPPNKSPRLIPEAGNSEKKKHDKTKPMSGLSSLMDLPPLQVTKARSPDTMLLPSLYSKEFREKSNLKEIDKLLDLNFDSIDNYEEDFILSANIDYEKNKNINSVLSKTDHKADTSRHFTPIKLFENENKSVNKNFDSKTNLIRPGSAKTEPENNCNENIKSSSTTSEFNKIDADSTSISEELDFNSNSENILKSDNT